MSLPKNELFFISGQLLNNGSPDMNVDGSVTPVEFTLDAPALQAGHNIYVNEIKFLLIDFKIDNNGWGNLAQLPSADGFTMMIDQRQGPVKIGNGRTTGELLANTPMEKFGSGGYSKSDA